VAIGYARAAAALGRRACLIDLDIVTPYFRVGDHRSELEQEGLAVIAPAGALASFEVPALPPDIPRVLADPAVHAVLDVGGDPSGARLLGAYAEFIVAPGYEMWMVANPYRPATAVPEGIVTQAREIEQQSGLRFTGLVANPNLGRVTQPRDIRAGLAPIEEAAGALKLPVVFLAVVAAFAEELASGLPALPLRLVLRLPWERAHYSSRPTAGA
jgi:hypothetical protein